MATEMSQQDVTEIKTALNRDAWRDPEKGFTQILLIGAMLSLIIFCLGYIFLEAAGTAVFGSIGIFSVLSMIGASLQIYSYSSDNRGY